MLLIIFLLFLVLFLGGFIFISMKINGLKNRAKQHILKDTGLSSSELYGSATGALEKKMVERFLSEHPSFTESSIKDLLKQYAMALINKSPNSAFSSTVTSKMEKDSKLDKVKSMEFKRATFTHYKNNDLRAEIIVADKKNEYGINLYCNVDGTNVEVSGYSVGAGTALGF